jgi:hypothetical protein
MGALGLPHEVRLLAEAPGIAKSNPGGQTRWRRRSDPPAQTHHYPVRWKRQVAYMLTEAVARSLTSGAVQPPRQRG